MACRLDEDFAIIFGLKGQAIVSSLLRNLTSSPIERKAQRILVFVGLQSYLPVRFRTQTGRLRGDVNSRAKLSFCNAGTIQCSSS